MYSRDNVLLAGGSSLCSDSQTRQMADSVSRDLVGLSVSVQPVRGGEGGEGSVVSRTR